MTEQIGEILVSVHWLVPVSIYIIIAYVGVRWLGKHLANQPDQIKRLTVNMGFCAVAGAIFAFLTGNLTFNPSILVVMGIGVLNAFANIAQWRANRVSMSKTSLLSFGDDIIAVLLAMAIVGDGRYLTAAGAVGMVLCFVTGVLFWQHDRSKEVVESNTFYMHVALYSVLWGVADFSLRFFALQQMPAGQFVFAWYAGSFLTLCMVSSARWLLGVKSDVSGVPFSLKEYAVVFVFAMAICICLAIQYWAKILAPQTVVGPIFLVSEAIIPTIIGWWIWKEGKKWDRAQWACAVLGGVSVVLLATGFR